MLFNAVPLLILAALYLAVGVAVAPALWRERGHAHGIGFATALVSGRGSCMSFARRRVCVWAAKSSSRR